MNNFNLHTPTRILFGKGAIANLREQIPADARVLITYGGGSVKKNGVLDQVYSALEGLDVREFSGIEPNPSYETLMKAVKIAQDEKTYLPAGGRRRLSAGWHQIHRCSGALRRRRRSVGNSANLRQQNHQRNPDGFRADAAGNRLRIQQRRGYLP